MLPFFPLAPFADTPTGFGQLYPAREPVPTQQERPQAGKPDRFGVYTVGGAVTSPVLTYSEPAVYSERMSQIDAPGTVLVTAILGPDGIPALTDVLIPFQRQFDRAAVRATNQLRFGPAKFNGNPVPVRIYVEYTFPRGMAAAAPNIVEHGSGMEPPVALNSVWVSYPKRARKQRQKGTVAISFVVTKEGQPTDLHLIRTVSRDLDESALRSVRRMRFKPAMLDNKPVPAHVTIDVEFLLYF